MGWNYRVISFSHDHAGRELETMYFAIHSVYYDMDGSPTSYGKEAASIGWDADEPDAPISILDMMRGALSKPVLNSKSFPS
jgi:hypothetical protein